MLVYIMAIVYLIFHIFILFTMGFANLYPLLFLKEYISKLYLKVYLTNFKL